MLVGRENELARIEQLLADATQGRSGALVITGDPGIGKTALLRAAVEEAAGFVVLRARGVAAESELPFAGLAELFASVVDLLAVLPDRQRTAMEGALALGPATSVDPLAVGVATLGLLAAAAERSPLVCAVDDLQWLDASSEQALTFAARRLQAEGIAMIFTNRRENGPGSPALDLDTVVLEGLSADAATQLVRAVAGAPIDDAVARWLHTSTRGNPLALVELPSLLSKGQLDGSEPLDDPLPPGPTTERAFRRQIAGLDADARTAVLVAAASGGGEASVIIDALDDLGIPAAALERAEEAGVVSLELGGVDFRHPLLRSAAYHGALASSRRKAHSALADCAGLTPWPPAPVSERPG